MKKQKKNPPAKTGVTETPAQVQARAEDTGETKIIASVPEERNAPAGTRRPPFLIRQPWIFALALALIFLAIDGTARLRTIYMVTDSGVGGTPALISDPKSITGYCGNQNKMIMPAIGTDGYHWIMQTQRMVSGEEGIRVRHTDYDNPPNGRDVHWSSLLHWVVAALGWVYAKATGSSIVQGLMWAMPWANTFGLVMFMLIAVPLVARRFGAVAASLLAIGFIAVYPYYEFSIVGYFDHHGLAASYDLAMVLFLVAGGAGWLRTDVEKPDRLGPVEKPLWNWLPDRRRAKPWFILSAFFGGMALWISAASVVPAMMGVGIAALVGTGWLGRSLNPKSPWKPDPTLWRLWGIAGCCSSLFFYALEYMPSNFTWRLEVNHPLFALSWLGAGDIICRLCQFLHAWKLPVQNPVAAPIPAKSATLPASDAPVASSDNSPFTLRNFVGVVIDLVLVASIPVAILTHPASLGYAKSFFIIPDYFLWSLHTDYIIEFRSLSRQLSYLSWQEIMGGISLVPVVMFLVIMLLWRNDEFKSAKILWWVMRIVLIGIGWWFIHSVYFAVVWQYSKDAWLNNALGYDSHQAAPDALDQATSKVEPIAHLLTLIPDAFTMLLLLLLPLAIETKPDLARPWKALLIVAVFPAGLVMLLAFKQIRWLGIDCALWLGVLATTALVSLRAGQGFKWTTTRLIVTGIFLFVIVVPYPCFTVYQWFSYSFKYPVTMLDLTQVITRDVSQRLRARLGDNPGVIVSGPTTTTWMMYFGGFKGLGTLYWENIDGLKKVASIYSAGSEGEALDLVKKYGVTDIAIYSWDPFADEYAKLWRGRRLHDQTPTDSFVYQLLHSGKIPVWLRPLPYRLPQDGQLRGQYVMLLEVALDQTPQEAGVRVAQYLMSEQLNDQAETQLRSDLANYPNYLPALIALARLQQSRGQVDAFTDTMLTIRDNLNQLDKIPFADRVDLVIDFALANDHANVQDQVLATLHAATENGIRQLQPDALFNFIELVRQTGMAGVNPAIMTFAFSLLSLEGQTQVLTEQGSVAAHSGQFAQAVKFYGQALSIEPNNYYVLNNLALILASAPDASVRNATTALALAQKAATIDNFSHVESFDTLAAAEAENGDYDNAIEHMNLAIDRAQADNATGNQTDLINKLKLQLKSYQQHKPVYN
jgi:tetratricopeptide (TPR) repeat protein